MKSVKIDLSSKLKGIEIHTFSDWHIGDYNCNMQLIKSEIERVKNTPEAYCILNGDLCNTALKTSVSDIYSEKLSPMEQINTCVELLEPIKDKILAITSGNHENRTYKNDGLEITRLIARQLGLEKRYASEGIVLFIRLGETSGGNHYRKQSYSIYVTHGTGGGGKVGSKANRLADVAGIIDVDVYLHAHTHLPLIFKEAFYRAYHNANTVALVDKLFVNTAAALKYGGYGQQAGFKPASTANPVIYLSGSKREMVAKL